VFERFNYTYDFQYDWMNLVIDKEKEEKVQKEKTKSEKSNS